MDGYLFLSLFISSFDLYTEWNNKGNEGWFGFMRHKAKLEFVIIC